MWKTHKVEQYKGLYGDPGSIKSKNPGVPFDYLPAPGAKPAGKMTGGGTGVKSHKTRQDHGNKKMKVS